MSLLKKTKEKANSSVHEVSSKLKEKVEQLASQPVTREVTLSYKSCCGCGCDWIDIIRTVPFDSPLQDGDRVKEMLPGDRTE